MPLIQIIINRQIFSTEQKPFLEETSGDIHYECKDKVPCAISIPVSQKEVIKKGQGISPSSQIPRIITPSYLRKMCEKA